MKEITPPSTIPLRPSRQHGRRRVGGLNSAPLIEGRPIFTGPDFPKIRRAVFGTVSHSDPAGVKELVTRRAENFQILAIPLTAARQMHRAQRSQDRSDARRGAERFRAGHGSRLVLFLPGLRTAGKHFVRIPQFPLNPAGASIQQRKRHLSDSISRRSPVARGSALFNIRDFVSGNVLLVKKITQDIFVDADIRLQGHSPRR